MVDYVINEPTGLGEIVLAQDAASMFQGWKRVTYDITPATGWGVLSHLEASGLGRPGDAPVLWALGRSSLPAGSPLATEVYDRTHSAGGQMGNSWDAVATTTTSGIPKRADFRGDDKAYFEALREWWDAHPVATGGADIDNSQALVEAGLMEAPDAPEDNFSLFGAIKGASRWLFLAFDLIPEGFDAVARAASAVKGGELSIGEAVGGMFGGEHSEITGIPLFTYLNSAWNGERLNMGTGWFARGDVAEDIKIALDHFDTVTWGPMDDEGNRTGGLTQSDFQRAQAQARERGEQGVSVIGLEGQTYYAKSLEEWKFLRDNVGRAGLLEYLIPRSAEQQALGVAHGAFQEQIFDEATVTRQPKSGRYFVQGSGTSIAAGVGNSVFNPGVMAPGTTLFDATSGTLDFGKQLLDLPLLGIAKAGGHLVSRAGRFVGLSDEAGRLANSTATANDIVRGADHGALGATFDDIYRGTINHDAAVNALARQSDQPLTAANTTVGALRAYGARYSRNQRSSEILEMVKSGMDRAKAENIAKAELSSSQIDQLIRRASQGDQAARKWAENVLNGTDKSMTADDVGIALDNLAEITARGDNDLLVGRFGKAQVDDTVLADATSRVDELTEILTTRKGWAIPDPTTKNPNRVTLTFDADLGRAQRTLDDLRKSSPDKQHQGIVNRLLGEHWATRRWAEKTLGDTDEASEQVDNLVRVLKRMDGDALLTDGARAVSPEITGDKLSALISGEGKAHDLIASLTDASTHREVRAILQPSVEFSGRVPPTLIDELARAGTKGEVTEVLLKLAAGQPILPQRMALLGNAARAANLSTVAGMSAGAIAGAAEPIEEGDFAGAIGGALGGAVLGALGGSALGSTAGYLFGISTRKIDDVADALDLMLAGTRATTADFLRSGRLGPRVDLGRAQAGLSAPSLLSYGLGHSALGRRLMRSAATNMNLSDPTDVYYKLGDYAQSLGLTIDDEVHFMVKQLDTGDELVEKVVKGTFKTQDEFQAKLDELTAGGYRSSEVVRMDDVFGRAAQLIPNNPASAYRVLRAFGRVVDANLAERGLPEEYRKLLTHFTENSETEFLGSLDGIGGKAAHMQYVVNGEVKHGALGARLESELWSGHIELPPPEKVQRAVNQLDKLGRTTQLFTGKGVLSQLTKNLSEVAGGREWQRITPELERQIAVRTARAVSQGLWAPVVLLGRPFAFLSRVLGEDQARMAASSLPNMFTHPVSYWSYVSANLGFFRKHGVLKGVASRSIIPDEVISGGKVDFDVLDDMTSWDLAEEARHALNIYDRRLSQERQALFGQRHWDTTTKGSQLYLDYLTGEIRQLVADPMVRHMARTTADDPIEDTLRWLNETSQGQKVKEDWARQFKSEQQAAEFMRPDNLGAFLHDQWARLQLKTGGSWVFKWGDAFVTSTGRGIGLEEATRKGWDKLEDGYTITRQGDSELIEMIATGRLKNAKLVSEDGVEYIEESLRIRDSLTDQKWDAVKDRIRDKHRKFEAQKGKEGYDPDTALSFPDIVKGSRSETLSLREKAQVWDYWETAVDRMYDWILGRPSRMFSRQPVFGAHYWERVGMLYPSMSEDMQKAYRAIAEKEGVWRHVRQVAGGTERAGVAAKGMLDDVGVIDLNAKAYAIERTRDILFDLHRQRNFIDGLRIIAPFAGPFVEALEAWGRVIRQQPLTVWRRGGQLIQHTWNTTGIGDQPDPGGLGWFYVDPETGDEMFNYPWVGRAIPSWLNKGATEGAADTLSGRARGLNIVFGTEDLTQGEGMEFMGFPVAAFNPGSGPVLQAAVAPLLKDRGGALEEIYNEMFPFGVPNNPWELLPYNLRKLFEGNLGEDSQRELVRHTVEQFGVLVANGEVGEGPQFSFDVSQPGGVETAWNAARERAIDSNWFEALARSVTPTLTTPEALVAIKGVEGLDSERLLTIGALADEARTLFSDEGAEWYHTPDGFRLSTEGDWEIVTDYMNTKYGMDMFSAEFLSLPLTDRPYPLVYTREGASWLRGHETLVKDNPASGPLVMPNYANLKESEALESQRGEPDDIGYSHEAFETAVEMGLANWFEPDEHKIEIQSRLLKMANRNVDIEAIERFGHNDQLDDEQKIRKDRWVRDTKAANAARYQGGDISDGQKTRVLKEVKGWRNIDWSRYSLSPEEQATVDAVSWYLDVLDQANATANTYGIKDVTLKGESEDEQRVSAGLKKDVVELVGMQMDHARRNGVDMGNFSYIWEMFLRTELEDDPNDFDQLEDLASIQALDLEEYLTPVGGP